MSGLAASGSLAWEIAALEAVGAGHEGIEPGHLAIGVLSLEKVANLPRAMGRLTAEERDAVWVEAKALAAILEAHGSSAAELRRRLRDALGTGDAATTRKSISRTPPTREAFASAERRVGSGEVTAAHLLHAVMDDATVGSIVPGGVGEDLARRWGSAPLHGGVGSEGRQPPGATAPKGHAGAGVDAGRGPDAGREGAASPGAAAGGGAEPGREGGTGSEGEAGAGAGAGRGAPPGRGRGAGREAGATREAHPHGEGVRSPTPELDRFGRDLTRLAKEGKLLPVVGRRDVLLEVIRTLAREGKANPLLVGEAGVGKTAVAEALAQRAADGKDEGVLGGLRIVELNLGLLLGGTEYRGEFEKRLTRLVEELHANQNVLVFIDEIHALMGAGRVGQGGLDAANLLKPALARGDFRCIGATTLAEYRQHVEPDAAFARRFVPIRVHEPTRDEALAILQGSRSRWEEHHGVRITDEALAAAVDLSVRFVPDRRLPDKAVDLVDLAAARTRVPALSASPGLAEAETGSMSGGVVTALTVAEVLAESQDLPLDLVRSGGAGGARLLELEAFLRGRLVGQDEAIARVTRRLTTAHAALSPREGPLGVFLFLGPTGVGKTEMARLLAEFLFGHRSALVRIDMSEYMEEHSVARLVGSPPGYVGHDEEGQLTGRLRAAPYSLVLFDEVEKAHPRVLDLFLQLFGDGRLTDAKGRLADGRQAVFVMTSNLGAGPGRQPMGFPADGRPVVAGGEAANEIQRFFRPELLNRVDEVISFQPLGRDAAARILRPLLESLTAAVARQHHVELSVSPEAMALLAEVGFSAAQGAREMRRTVERLVEAPLSQLVLSGLLVRSRSWRLVRVPTGVEIQPSEAAARPG